MATNKITWSALTGLTSGISNASVNAAARIIGSEINNTTTKSTYLAAELQFTPASAPTAGDVFSIYLLYAADGTNYEDGDNSTTPGKNPDAIIPVRAANAAQRITCPYPIPVLPAKFKPLVINSTAVNATGITLSLSSIDPDIQAAS